MKAKIIQIPLLIPLFLLIGLLPTRAATRHVWMDSPLPAAPYDRWENAAHELQTAVDEAQAGDTVLVTNGVYAAGGKTMPGLAVSNRVAVSQAITLMSVNGAAVTIIEGSGPHGSSAVRGVYLTNGAALVGFTVTGGHTLTNGNTTDRRGGGIVMDGGCVVSNCVVQGNRAALRAGGIYILSGNGLVANTTIAENEAKEFAGLYGVYGGEIDHCLVVSNTASGHGGGVIFWNAGTIRDSVIRDNTAWGDAAGVGFWSTGTCLIVRCQIKNNYANQSGGGVYLRAGAVLADSTIQDNVGDWDGGGGVLCNGGGAISNCLIIGNVAGYGGGIRFLNGGSARNCVIRDNYAWYWSGGVHCNSGGLVENSTIFNNWSRDVSGGVGFYAGGTAQNCAIINNVAGTRGGGAVFVSPNGVLRNCTLANNRADRTGAAWWGDSATIENTIAWGNQGPRPYDGSIQTNRYNCLQDWTGGGEGIVAADPQLLAGFHIASNSPCRGAGLASAAVGQDIDGQDWAARPSIGCDEPGPAVGALSVSFVNPATDYRVVRIAPNYACQFAALVQGVASQLVWDFGDGVRQTNATAVFHTWSAPGDYPVVLTAFNDDFPQGVSLTNWVNVMPQEYYYVNAASPHPSAPYATWDTAARNIQDAVDECVVGGTVLVTNGTYSAGGYCNDEYALPNRVIIERDIVVRSVNGPEFTLITGEGDRSGGLPTNGPSAVRCVFISAGVLSGFTLSGGHTLLTGNWEQEQSGGGAYAIGGTLSNCVIRECGAGIYGGGVIGGTVLNCRLENNRCGTLGSGTGAGGGAAFSRLSNTQIRGNTAHWGGGVYCEKGDELSQCTVAENTGFYGGGIRLSQGGAVERCIIENNRSTEHGGGLNLDAGGVVRNSIIRHNTARFLAGGAMLYYGGTLQSCAVFDNASEYMSGGLHLWGNNAVVRHCTITHNRAGRNGASLVCWGLEHTLENCIVWDNAGAPDGEILPTTNRYNCVQYWPGGGEGMLSNNPRLVDGTHLGAGSPCIGTGMAAVAGETDLDGTAWDMPPSIGCDEYRVGPVTGALSVAIHAPVTTMASHYQGRFSASVTGQATQLVWSFGDGSKLTNAAVALHAWDAAGDFPLVLTAFNDAHPGGISATVLVHVVNQPVCYVNAANPTPRAPYDSWATAATAIQDAVDVCLVGGTVLVTNGTYRTGAFLHDRYTLPNRVLIQRDITVISVNGPEYTAITGSGDWDGAKIISGPHATRCVYLDAGTLSGFTLSGGNTLTEGDAEQDKSGGGAYAIGGVLSNCVIKVCSANTYGGGVIGGTLLNCRIENNTGPGAGGGVYLATLRNCVVSGNTSREWGGGVHDSTVYDSQLLNNQSGAVGSGTGAGGGAAYARLFRTELRGNRANWGGGLSHSAATDSTMVKNTAVYGGGANVGELTNCVLRSNSATYGGGGAYNGDLLRCQVVENTAVQEGGGTSRATVLNSLVASNAVTSWDSYGNGGGVLVDAGHVARNCLIIGNRARGGAGVRFYGHTVVQNCTLVGNNGAEFGNAAYGDYAGTLENCIVWGNQPAPRDGGGYISCVSAIRFNCIEGWTGGGEGNLNYNPKFLNPAAGDYRLAPDSPLIGAGVNFDWVSNSTDLAENPRLAGERVEMGAYEMGTLAAGFTADRTAGIGGLTNVQFAAVVTGTNTTGLYYRWDLDGDGTVDAEGPGLTQASFNYATPGMRTVSLHITGAGGQDVFLAQTNYIRVYPPVEADFISNRQVGSAPIQLSFTDLSRNEPQSWAWDFNGDGIIDSTNQHPYRMFTNTGTYTITLTVSNNFGLGGRSVSTLTRTNYIQIPAGAFPIYFVAEPALARIGQPVQFFNQVSNTHGPVSFAWDFNGDGVIDSRDPNPVWSFDSTGFKPVRLIVTDDYSSNSWTRNKPVRIYRESFVDPASPAPARPYDTWATAAHVIQEAIDAAAPADVITVTNGVYATGGAKASYRDDNYGLINLYSNRVVLNKAVRVQSANGPEVTWIVGEPDKTPKNINFNDSSQAYYAYYWTNGFGSNTVRCAFLTNGAELVGFTLTNGFAGQPGWGVPDHAGNGGGAFLARGSVLSNCVVTGCSALGDTDTRGYDGGGGVYLCFGGQVSRCVIRSNIVYEGDGGGVYANNGGEVLDSEILGNRGGSTLDRQGVYGGGALIGGAAVIRNCLVQANSVLGSGGGVALYIGGTADGCVIQGNSAAGSGGGLHFYNGSLARNCSILENDAAFNGGGVFSTGGSAAVVNSWIHGNRAAQSGGGLCREGAYYYQGSMNATNCTITRNTAGNSGGGTAGAFLQNSIVYFNQITNLAADPRLANHTGSTFNHSCTTPLPSGGNDADNFADDPGLAGSDNPHLLAGSPCIDHGLHFSSLPATDFEGDPRVWPGNGAMDIGCDEFVPGPQRGLLVVGAQAALTNAVVGGPLVFRAEIEGWPERVEWRIQQPDGLHVFTNINLLTERWSVPGEYAVTLWVSNQTGEASSTRAVRILAALTNYVSLSGGHVPPYDSWATAATNLQAAVDALNCAGATVMVDDGLFTLSNQVHLRQPLVLQSRQGREATTLAASTREEVVEQEQEDDYGEIIIVLVTNRIPNRILWIEADGVTVRGFTFTNGVADGYETHGGAVHMQNAGWLTDCSFRNNQAPLDGGAIYLAAGGMVSNCLFTANTAQNGGAIAARGGAHITHCRIEANSASSNGGGVSLDNSGQVVWSQIVSNQAVYGGGLHGGMAQHCQLVGNSAKQVTEYNWWADEETTHGGEGGGANSARLEDCEVAGNRAINGGGLASGSAFRCVVRDNLALESGGGARLNDRNVLENCALFGNRTGGNGGGMLLAANAVARHCTVFSNYASDRGAGVFAETGAVIRNSIAYHNDGPIEPNASGGSWEYSCMQPLQAGPGNVAEDPRLAGLREWHLLPASPCLDAGLDIGVANDLDGETRPWPSGGAPDMGCDEVKLGALTGPLALGMQAPFTQAVAGSELEFQAEIQGRALGARWSVTTGGGSVIVSDVSRLRQSWNAPGEYQVTLTVSNQTSLVSTALTVTVVGTHTNYVSTSGRHIWPFTNWANAATNLEAGIAASLPGGTVLLGDGVYPARNEIVITKAIRVVGANGRNAVVIDASGNGPTDLSNLDILNPGGLLKKLHDTANPVSVYIWNQLPPEVQATLPGWIYRGAYGEYANRLAATFNTHILHDAALYDEQRFAGIPLTWETRQLLATQPQGEALARLNRQLLRDTFPAEVARISGGGRCFSLWHPDAQIESLTIAGGNASQAASNQFSLIGWVFAASQLPAELPLLERTRGGGVYLARGGTVRDCLLVGNRAESAGNAVFFNGSGRVVDCELSENPSGSGSCVHAYYGGTLERSRITHNSGTGFTAWRGGVLRGSSVLENGGDGVHLQAGGRVEGCSIISNAFGATLDGPAWMADTSIERNEGGVSCINTSVVTNCVIRANGGGGDWWNNGPLMLGAGVACSQNALVIRCRIEGGVSGSFGGGAWVESGGTLQACLVVGNRAAKGGGGVLVRDGGIVQNCAVLDNDAGESGGGVYVLPGGVLRNSTVINNRSQMQGGGMLLEAGGVARNCIAYHNTAGINPNVAAGPAEMSRYYDSRQNGPVTNAIPYGAFEYGCAYPAPPGPGNIADEPALLGLNNPHLAAGSPCIGAGHNRYANGTDLDGDPRVVPANGRTDIGCDEWTGGESGALTGGFHTEFDKAVMGAPVKFTADLSGQAQGFEWILQTPDGLRRFSGALTYAWSQPGTYAVTLHATNADSSLTVTTNITIGATATTYASPTGRHLPPFANWTDAATNLQAAVDAAWLGGTVLLDNGLFADAAEVVVAKAVTLRGRNGRNFTRVDGGGAHRVFRLSHAQAVLADMTITNGLAEYGGAVWVDHQGLLSGCDIRGNVATYGGGVFLDFGGRLENCAVIGNTSGTNGGGLFVRWSGQAANCRFEGNQATNGGGIYLERGGLLTHCQVLSNRASNLGGGVVLRGSGVCEWSTISGNSAWQNGAGLYLDGSATLHHSVITSNQNASSGGGVYLAGYSRVQNCLLVGNASTSYGGGIYIAGGIVENCTITANSTGYRGGGIGGGGSRQVFNSIIYFNHAGWSWNNDYQENGDAYVHCDLWPSRFFTNQGWGTGDDCMDIDPQFVDASNGDYRLKPTSPCLNAGTNEVWRSENVVINGQWVSTNYNLGTPAETDLDGHLRIGRGVVDLGAYEFQHEPIAFTLPNEQLIWPGTHRVTWIQNDPAGLVGLEVWRDGQALMVATGLARTNAYDWNTTTTADGYYDFRITLRDSAGQVLGEDRRSVFINNSLSWHSGTLTSSQTWDSNSVHLVTGDLIIGPGITLDIAPGAIVKFAPGARLRVGSGGTLNAPATSGTPIVFTTFADDTAGGDSNLDGGATQPRPGQWGGISAEGGLVQVSDAVELRYTQATTGGTLAGNESWLGSKVYLVSEDLTVPAGVTLTINPGAIIKFADKRGIVVQAGGTLNALGTLAQPILFTSDKDDTAGGDTNGDADETMPSAGDWRQISLEGGMANLAHATLSYGGGSTSGAWDGVGVLRLDSNASLVLSNCVVRDIFFDGVLVSGSRATLVNSVFANTDRAIIAFPGGTVDVNHGTLYGNRMGLFAHGGRLNAINTLVANSLELGAYADIGGVLDARFCNVWSPTGSSGGFAPGSSGNISQDPKLRSPESGGYQLDYLSPCIDAADGRVSPELDHQGTPRYDDNYSPNRGAPDIAGKPTDIGAFEFNLSEGSGVDLVVTDVQGPARVTANGTVWLTWTLRNAGTRAFSGAWHDAVALWDDHGTGELIGEQEFLSQGRLGPGQEMTITHSFRVPGATEAPYRWRVQANRRGEIFEGSLITNNVTFAAGPVDLVVPEIRVGETNRGEWAGGVGRTWMFKFRAPAGRNLQIKLTPEFDLNGVRMACQATVSLLLAADRAPTEDNYDAQSFCWMDIGVPIILDQARDAWYYLSFTPRQMRQVGWNTRDDGTSYFVSNLGYLLRATIFEDLDLAKWTWLQAATAAR
jgi:predicted outer membrane repeat protein